MAPAKKLFIGILLGYALGVGALMYGSLATPTHAIASQPKNRWRETAQLLALLVEGASRDGALLTETLGPLFQSLYARRFAADIFGLEKTRVELRLTAVDRAGMVVFDSMKHHVGADHSQWHDIHLALQGEYGARTSRLDETVAIPLRTLFEELAASAQARGRGAVATLSLRRPAPGA